MLRHRKTSSAETRNGLPPPCRSFSQVDPKHPSRTFPALCFGPSQSPLWAATRRTITGQGRFSSRENSSESPFVGSMIIYILSEHYVVPEVLRGVFDAVTRKSQRQAICSGFHFCEQPSLCSRL